jgi:hypothetical protein
MLIRPRNIFEVEPPFLIVFGHGDWKVAREIFPHPDGVAYLEPFSTATDEHQPDGVVQGEPWHVGDNVWEMDFNGQIMTLDHPHYHSHPAWRLWLQWLASRNTDNPARSH